MLTNDSRFKNRSAQTFGFVYHDTNGLNHGPVSKKKSFFLKGICTVTFWQDYCGKGNWEKIPNWECLFVHREKGLFLFVSVVDIKLVGKKQNLDLMWKVLNKEVDLGEPIFSWIMYTLGCT